MFPQATRLARRIPRMGSLHIRTAGRKWRHVTGAILLAALTLPAPADASRRCGHLPYGKWPNIDRIAAHDVGGCKKARNVARKLRSVMHDDPEPFDPESGYFIRANRRTWECTFVQYPDRSAKSWCHQLRHHRRYVRMRLLVEEDRA